MRTRRRLTWLIFAICILAVLEGLGWVTWHALRLEKSEREAKAAAQFQQSIRLALWRMESEVTPIIAAEAARPYFQYMPFYPAERAYTKMFQQVKPNEVLVPSPLLENSGPYLHLHYQIGPDGAVTSPQAPTGNMRDLAEGQKYVDSEFIVLAGQMLDELGAIRRPAQDKQPVVQLGTLPEGDALRKLQSTGATQGQQQAFFGLPGDQRQVQAEDSVEYKAREKAAQTAQTLNIASDSQRRKSGTSNDRGQSFKEAPSDPEKARDANKQVAAGRDEPIAPGSAAVPPPTPPPASAPVPRAPAEAPKSELSQVDEKLAGKTAGDGAFKKDQAANRAEQDSLVQNFQSAGTLVDQNRVEQGSFTAHWYANPKSGDDELVLERSVLIDGRETVQGLWVDWPLLRDQLHRSIVDLLPAAVLSPALDSANDAGGQRLAAIPVRLLPGAIPALQASAASPMHVTLLVTWAAVLGAIAAIGLVLRKAMELSERRGRFVSAVTHELRTPLTTFCLYTEMLSDGMVTDEAARKQYLGTLKGESNRLARIVQNVLDYAGIGGVGRRTPGPAAPMSAKDLVERLSPAIEHCATRAGMTLSLECDDLERVRVQVDPQTVERIVLNLVENAGKYAGEALDRRIHVMVRRGGGKGETLSICVRDHGPGVPKTERRRVFQAFHRATRDAQGPKSGLGLGLALARELARELGGRLTLNAATTDGAEFCLCLPCQTLTNY